MKTRKVIGSVIAAIAAVILATLATPALADGSGTAPAPASTSPSPSPQVTTNDTWWG